MVEDMLGMFLVLGTGIDFLLMCLFVRSHKKALRQVAFHTHYPLFASASDDGTVIICHGRVYK